MKKVIGIVGEDPTDYLVIKEVIDLVSDEKYIQTVSYLIHILNMAYIHADLHYILQTLVLS